MTASRPATFDDLRRRRWELLALTSVGAFMGPLDGAIVSVALPVMSPDLGLSFSASMWVQAAYLLAMAVLLIPLGGSPTRAAGCASTCSASWCSRLGRCSAP